MAKFCEYAAKPLLRDAGIKVPSGEIALTPDAAKAVAERIGPCVVKAQVPTGKRGKAGGIQLARNPTEARDAAARILGMAIGGFEVDTVLVEEQVDMHLECYLSILNDANTCGPLVLISAHGGMDVEQILEEWPGAVRRIPVNITKGLNREMALAGMSGLELNGCREAVADTITRLYGVYKKYDADLLEVNPLAITVNRDVMALDCKFSLDDASAGRQSTIASLASADPMTPLEAEAAAAGLKYIELGGSVGILANGAGLTMTTMDAVSHFGGSPANFLEIGGEAYTNARTALSILLKNPRIRSLLVNFCGAFARTDVMAQGVVEAMLELKPSIPVFFSIHGTGSEEAIETVIHALGIIPSDSMDGAVRSAVRAAEGETQ